jgi:trypsin
MSLVVSLFCGVGCGQASFLEEDEPAENVGELSQSLVGGQLDRDHDAVLAVVASTRSATSLCTGTLIAPNLVLTAQHCVANIAENQVDCASSRFGDRFDADSLGVAPYATLSGRTRYFPVAEVVLPGEGDALCGHDIALLILGGRFDVAELPAVDPRLDVPAARGESYTAVGFGDAQAEGDPGVRRARDGLSVVCGARDCGGGSVLTDSEFVGEESVCEGDSGGPALDASGRVIGVASRGAEDCGIAVYSAVAYWGDWMISTATRAAEIGQYEAPGWAQVEDALPDDEVEPVLISDVVGADSPGVAPEPDTDFAARSSDGGCSSAGVPDRVPAPAAALAGVGLLLVLAGARRNRRVTTRT